jgi:hypothetical protein
LRPAVEGGAQEGEGAFRHGRMLLIEVALDGGGIGREPGFIVFRTCQRII